MKIAVIGAGAMGSMLGAYLQAGGADVTLVVRRKELADVLKSPGLTMKRYTEGTEDGNGPVPMKASVGTDGLEVMDAVLLMVKGPDTKAAIEGASAVIGPETRPCLKNSNMTKGERFFHRTRRFSAGILCVFQGKATRYGGKRSAVWACCHFSNKA